jgi:CubicO group peptidase (beta-lactamase class C family)
VLAHFDPLWLGCDDGMCGVHASPLDNLRFLEMVRNGGMAGDTRVLSPAAIRVMTTNQIPGVAAVIGPYTLSEASGAYAFNVGTADALPYFRGGTPSRGTLRHGGSGGIASWIDPDLGITGVYFELVTEEDEAGMPLSWAVDRFEDIVTSAVVD